MGKTPSLYHPHVVGPVLGDGGVGGEGEVFVVSCVVACCLLVQCILEIAALFLVTVATHRPSDCVSMTRLIVLKEILSTSNLCFSGRCGRSQFLWHLVQPRFFFFRWIYKNHFASDEGVIHRTTQSWSYRGTKTMPR